MGNIDGRLKRLEERIEALESVKDWNIVVGLAE